MEIKILGTHCKKCETLNKKINELIEKYNISASVEFIDDINEMLNYGIMMTPGLVINEEVKSFGIVPKEAQLLQWLQEN